jgi:hypothetical protein
MCWGSESRTWEEYLSAVSEDTGSPIRRLLSRGQTFPIHNFLALFLLLRTVLLTRGAPTPTHPCFRSLWCRPAAWVRTSHPSGSRPWEGLSSGRVFPRPWQRDCPRKPSVPCRVQEGRSQILGLPYGSNPWVAPGMGVPVVAPQPGSGRAGWDSSQSGLVVANQPLHGLTAPAPSYLSQRP